MIICVNFSTFNYLKSFDFLFIIYFLIIFEILWKHHINATVIIEDNAIYNIFHEADQSYITSIVFLFFFLQSPSNFNPILNLKKKIERQNNNIDNNIIIYNKTLNNVQGHACLLRKLSLLSLNNTIYWLIFILKNIHKKCKKNLNNNISPTMTHKFCHQPIISHVFCYRTDTSPQSKSRNKTDFHSFL